MALENLTATISITSDISAVLYVPAFLWCSVKSIQRYLGQVSQIIIGQGADEYSYDEEDAEEMENDAVNTIVNYLSMSVEVTTSTDVRELKGLAAKLTAAMIGMATMGAGMGNSAAAWTVQYENAVWGRLMQIFLSQSLPGVTAKSISKVDRLLYYKSRQRSEISVEP